MQESVRSSSTHTQTPPQPVDEVWETWSGCEHYTVPERGGFNAPCARGMCAGFGDLSSNVKSTRPPPPLAAERKAHDTGLNTFNPNIYLSRNTRDESLYRKNQKRNTAVLARRSHDLKVYSSFPRAQIPGSYLVARPTHEILLTHKPFTWKPRVVRVLLT